MSRSTALVTGGSSGIGFALCESLLKAGWRVITLSRQLMHSHPGFVRLNQTYSSDVFEVVQCDLADLSSIRTTTSNLRRANITFDVLFNNAAVNLEHPKYTDDGLDYHCQVNVLAPYALILGLLPSFRTGATIINVSGLVVELVRTLDLDQLFGAHKHRRFFGSYAQSKLAMIALTQQLARQFDGRLYFRAVDPGPTNTPLARGHGMPTLLRPFYLLYKQPARAAKQLMAAAFAPKFAKDNGIYISFGLNRSPPKSTTNHQTQHGLITSLNDILINH